MEAALAWTGVYLAKSKAAARTFFAVVIPFVGRCLVTGSTAVGSQLLAAVRVVRSAHQLHLFVTELAGVVLTAYGISWWSVPAAVIIGGLVLVAAVEVRPHGTAIPDLPIPEVLVRAQAEQAARLINNVRYGVPEVDAMAIEKLSRSECERIITLAKAIGAKTNAL